MFDLPVLTAKDRKGATDFRKKLLDLGFEMSQLSVYMRFCTGKEKTERLLKMIQKGLPDGGQVDILFFTDKQYEKILTYRGKSRQKARKNPDQFTLF